MTNEQYEVLKQDYIDHIKEYVTENGSLFPHLTIFADIRKPKPEEENKPALIHIPIPEEMMMDDEGKDKFVSKVFPKIAEELKKKFVPTALAWTAEAWVRTMNKNKDLSNTNWKELPIEKEVIIIIIESNHDKKCVIYDIIRDGKQINSEGEMVDKVELIEAKNLAHPDGIGGRFSGLFAKLKD